MADPKTVDASDVVTSAPPVVPTPMPMPMPEPTEWSMALSELIAMKACDLGTATFADRFTGIDGAEFDKGSQTWRLPHGWTDECTKKVAREAPVSLRWYVRHGLIPISFEEMCAAVREAQHVPDAQPLGLPSRTKIAA